MHTRMGDKEECVRNKYGNTLVGIRIVSFELCRRREHLEWGCGWSSGYLGKKPVCLRISNLLMHTSTGTPCIIQNTTWPCSPKRMIVACSARYFPDISSHLSIDPSRPPASTPSHCPLLPHVITSEQHLHLVELSSIMIQTDWFGRGFKLRAAITVACQIVRILSSSHRLISPAFLEVSQGACPGKPRT